MKKYKCEICGEEFENQIEFAKHILKCEENQKKEEKAKAKAQKEAEREEKRKEIEKAYQALEKMVCEYTKEYGSLQIKNKENTNLSFYSSDKLCDWFLLNRQPFNVLYPFW